MNLTLPLFRPTLSAPPAAANTPQPPPETAAANEPRAADKPPKFTPAPPLQVYPHSQSMLEWARQAQAPTIPLLFARSVHQYANNNFLGERAGDEYKYLNYSQTHEKTKEFASALVELGFQPGDRVAIMAEGRPEWMVSDLGTYQAGGVVTSLYHSLSKGDFEHEMKDSGSRIMVCNNDKELTTVLNSEDNLPNLEHIVYAGPKEDLESLLKERQLKSNPSDKKYWAYDDFMKVGHDSLAKNQAEVTRRTVAVQPTDIATLIYTSGTTGLPKGVMMSHGAMAYNVEAMLNRVGGSPNDVEYTFLPLSHILQRSVAYAMTGAGAALAFANAHGMKEYFEGLHAAKPSIVVNIPQFWEGVQDKVKLQTAGELEKSSPIFDHKGLRWIGNAQKAFKKTMYHWAVGVQERHSRAEEAGKVPPMLEAKNDIARRLVLDPAAEKTYHKMGFANARLFVSGGAAFRREASQFWIDSGKRADGTKAVMCEGYGMTEQLLTVNDPKHPRAGTVGVPIDGVTLRIGENEEILARGPNMMNGYLNRPDATAETIQNGELHTGDMGAIDHGSVRITGRIKELEKPGGKLVPPVPIEARVLANCKYVQQIVAIGDTLPHMGALVVPRPEAFADWCKAKGIGNDYVSLAHSKDVKDFLMAEISKCCESLSDHEKIRSIALLERPLSVEAGELVPGLEKIKRSVVKKKYQAEIETLFPKK